MKVKAVILAAGFGTRMGHYTKDLPKPMLPLNGKPMMEYTLQQLKHFGVKDFGINLHYLHEKITDYFGMGEKLGININYIYESTPSGTAGGVKNLEAFLKDADQIIVVYGDIICDLDYGSLLDFHINHRGIGTVCLHHRKKSNSIVNINEKAEITEFIERPSEEVLSRYNEGFWVNSAIYCFSPEILKRIPENTVSDFPRDIFPELVASGKLFGYKLNANRYAIDSEEKYLEAETNFKNFDFKK